MKLLAIWARTISHYTFVTAPNLTSNGVLPGESHEVKFFKLLEHPKTKYATSCLLKTVECGESRKKYLGGIW